MYRKVVCYDITVPGRNTQRRPNRTERRYPHDSPPDLQRPDSDDDFHPDRRSCYDHEVEILYILRGPAGNDVFRTERKTLEGGPSNWRWNWYYPLEDMIWEMSGNSYLVDPGSYMFEVYFNDCRVSRKEFVLTK